MSKLTRTYYFDENSKKYFLKIHRSAGFMEPYTKYQLIEESSIPSGVSVLSVRIKAGCESYDLGDLQQQFEYLSIDAIGMNSDMICES